MSQARLAALVAGSLLACAPAAHAVGWTPAVGLQPSSPGTGGIQNNRIEVNAAGDQVTAWDNMTPGGDDVVCQDSEITTRVPGGDWATPVAVAAGTCAVEIAIGPTGKALALWQEGTDLMAATAQAGSSFGTGQVAVDGIGATGNSTAAIEANGRVTIAWAEYDSVPGNWYYRTKIQNADGSWPESYEEVLTSREAGRLTLAAGPLGDTVLAYSWRTLPPDPTYLGVQALSRAAGETAWTTPVASDVASGDLFPPTAVGEFTAPVVKYDGDGRPTVMVSHQQGPTTGLLAWTREAGADGAGAWSPMETVPNSTASGVMPSGTFALDSAGNAQAAWIWHGGAAYEIRVATRAAGSTAWSTALVQLPAGACPPTTPSVTFDTDDNAFIGYACGTTSYTYRRAAGGTTYSAFTPPAGAEGGVQYTTDPNGYLIATWVADGITYTSVYDPVAPTLDAFDPAAPAVAGEPATFNITGSDVWGPVTWTVDFGDGQPSVSGRAASGALRARARATNTNSVSHTYANAGSYTATITVNDAAGNSVQQSRAVTVADPPATGAQVTPPAPLPPVPGLPDPVLGQTVNIAPVKLPVRVREPGSRVFAPLTAPKQVRVGSIIDVRRGRVRVTIQNKSGRLDTADFYAGMFRVRQLATGSGFATMELYGGRFRGCPRAPKARLAAKRSKRAIRRLWANGTGAFRTKGRFSAASIRGTIWLTQDRCDATVTRVRQGSVVVRDFVRRRSVVVRARRTYVARARAARRR